MNRIQKGLYDSSFEHDACGIGAVVNIKGNPTYGVVDDALKIVEKLEHRAGKDALGETGDGVGIMVQVSHNFFGPILKDLGFNTTARSYGVGMFFFSQDKTLRMQAQNMFEIILKQEGLEFMCWREVPTNQSILGKTAIDCMPYIMQAFVKRPNDTKTDLDFERKLYIARRNFEQSSIDTYVPSLSCRTIVYKGMFLVQQLRNFYLDLLSPEYTSAIALVHSRFSTNTTPSWRRAHPNRIICHNGEINTIRGNINRMLSREETMHSTLINENEDKIYPVVNPNGSDSAMLDNTLEFLMMNGMDLPLAMLLIIPEPFRSNLTINEQKRDMYEYYSTMMEPWDGPASILFTDGDILGATLDRNGLRPSRYYVTKDDRLVLSSEVGVLDFDDENILKKSRLEPGKMLLVDTKAGKIISDDDLKNYYASRHPYGEWLNKYLIRLDNLAVPNVRVESFDKDYRQQLYKAFGYTYEDFKTTILSMARDGSEEIASMGIDIPLAVLSDKHQPLFSYFKQIFAQVTNPPIDAIREEIVTDTTVYLGYEGNLLEDKGSNCNMLQLPSPILSNTDLLKLKYMKKEGFQVETISLLYYNNTSLEAALQHLFNKIDAANRRNNNIIILSDRGVDENHMAIPSLLAVSAVEQHLIRTKKRTAVSIVLESGEPRDVHHFATLLGSGARAICPYLAYEAIADLIESDMLNKELHIAINSFNNAVTHGIIKIASKMGISTLQSYQSAQIFEIVGISKDVVDKYFTNITSRVGGITLTEIDGDVKYHHSHAFDPLGLATDTTLDSSGSHKMRTGSDKDDHLYNPLTIVTLQKATRLGDYNLFKEYTARVDDENTPHTLRGLLRFNYEKCTPISIDEVESVDEIVKRFKTGAMSYGSISQEAHECMAIAMNTLGGKSNSGEGGELQERLLDNRCSAIKQVASARFGVTSQYLNSAGELQIKLAQGAKPGEGGHLPGKKVYPWIAKTRLSTPGVSLISPPPHHDIYSIEDLAQLIYDLKNANKDARISVKLVSESGVGTIASGVAKAGAQVILISGYDGGTGAAAKSSIHNAGLPWELGLSETHQTLLENGLRSRVIVETDGKLMSGRDVAIAALLGAEEFGFATAPLVTMGCVMMRVCEKDTCPTGIATQNPELRKRFKGKPEYIINFMRFIAQELREIMAKLGIKTVNELVGRTDLLSKKTHLVTVNSALINIDNIIKNPFINESKQHFVPQDVFDFELEKTLDETVLIPKFAKAMAKNEPLEISSKITSINRTCGTLLGSLITKKYQSTLKEDTYVVNFTGGAGQSFGAFIPKGLTLKITGDSNDYFGKGLSGGKLVLKTPQGCTFNANENIIVGNVALYGATSGSAYINGVAGERFAVRNSGATAVVEGVGEHGCEYMTGGRVVVLGNVGKNFAAGMSGGFAYVLDKNHDLYKKVNTALVTIEEVVEQHDIDELHTLIENHYKETNSKVAQEILKDFYANTSIFKKIVPRDYQKMLTIIAQMKAKGLSDDEANLAAFNQVNNR